MVSDTMRVLMRRLVRGLVSASLVLGGWPLGWLPDERNPLATPQAEAAAGDILLWDKCRDQQRRQEGIKKE